MSEPQKSMIEDAARNYKARRSVYLYKREQAANANREEVEAYRELEAARKHYDAICEGLLNE